MHPATALRRNLLWQQEIALHWESFYLDYSDARARRVPSVLSLLAFTRSFFYALHLHQGSCPRISTHWPAVARHWLPDPS